MANILQRNLATGNTKTYYQNEDGLVATGTLYTNWDIYYTAAHPKLGLWVCAHTMNNAPVVIGFIHWNNIKRIVLDNKNDLVFIVVKNYQEIIDNADWSFRKLYKKSFSHQMNDNGDMSVFISKDLCTGNILPYLQEKYPIEYKEEKVEGNIWTTIILIIATVLILLGACLKIYEIFF